VVEHIPRQGVEALFFFINWIIHYFIEVNTIDLDNGLGDLEIAQ
jgi:hypothetical protein